jgi:hypothetical protein
VRRVNLSSVHRSPCRLLRPSYGGDFAALVSRRATTSPSPERLQGPWVALPPDYPGRLLGGGVSSSYGVYFLMFTPSSFVTSRKQVAKLGCARVTRFEAAQETVGTAKAQSTLIGCAFSIPNRVQNELLLILAGEASHLWSGVWSNGIGQAV